MNKHASKEHLLQVVLPTQVDLNPKPNLNPNTNPEGRRRTRHTVGTGVNARARRAIARLCAPHGR